MSWSVIRLALLDDGLWLKEKVKELVQEGKNKWPRGATSRSGSQWKATTNGRAAMEGNSERFCCNEGQQQAALWRDLEERLATTYADRTTVGGLLSRTKEELWVA